MTKMLAYCPTCKATFANQNFINVRGKARVKVENVRTRCPLGHNSFFLDGQFEIIGESVRLLSGPALTREMFERVIKIIERSGPKATAGEIAKEAGDVHPSLGKIVEKAAGDDLNKSGSLLRMTILAVLSAVALTKCNIHLDVNRLIDQMHKSAESEVQSATPSEKKDQEHKHSASTDPAKKGTDYL